MNDPDYVHVLSSGVHVTDEDVSPHPLIAEDVDHQIREMRRSRAAAEISSRDYMISS